MKKRNIARENYLRRLRRDSNPEKYNKKAQEYERTKRGFIMRKYRNMLSRISGIQKMKHHLYKNKRILPKEEFYQWAFASKEFHKLFKAWEESGYERKLSPSVDRINSEKGYFIENMEWVTHSENSRRGSLSQIKKQIGIYNPKYKGGYK